MYSILKDRAVLQIEGEDRYKFLQGLITNDVNKLKTQESIYACMLTPQGKYFADFFLKEHNEAIYVDIPANRKEEILKKLLMYRLRSSVDVVHLPKYQVVSFLDNEPCWHELKFLDPRRQVLGWRCLIKEGELNENEPSEPSAYNLIRIKNLIAEGDKDLIADKSFPLEYGFDNLNAIDYNKGCYLGQELVARTHYSGVIRKGIYQVTSKQILPPLGTEIYVGEIRIGTMCSSEKNEGLALVRIEEFDNLVQGSKIMANKQEIYISRKK